jgi:hypothetical protein
MAGAGKPGRPRRDGGPDRVRSLRSGAVYDRASAIAAEQGTTVSAVINAALTTYVIDHDGDLSLVSTTS